MNTRSYLLHGHKVTVVGEDPILVALQRRIGLFPPADSGIPSRLHFSYHRIPDQVFCDRALLPSGPNHLVLELAGARALYFDATEELYIDVPGRARVLCNTETRQVNVTYPQSSAGDIEFLAHLCFTLPLAELLKREGLYMIHAAGLCLDGKGLLVAGASASGKTTLAISLLRGGFGFLSDDTTFFTTSRGLRALAFPDEIDVTERTAGYFPELRNLAKRSSSPRRHKHSFNFTHLYSTGPTWECTPAVLVFPRAVGASESVLTSMPKSEALIELLCNVVRTETRSAQAHLDALAALVKQCRCYRLHAGRDFDVMPTLFRSFLNENVSAQSPSSP